VKLLLDTHIVLWVLTGDGRLSTRAIDMITESDDVFVSAVSIWEIAIKYGLNRAGPNRMPYFAVAAIERCQASGFEFLTITPRHAAAVGLLPDLHGDPFDRVLIAQALTEPQILLTHDQAVAAYSDTVVLV
jgi:PIN domain nuclease of toxin-antitoxin system